MRDELETPRLLLRRWRPDDLDALARWHVDPELMRHWGSRLSRARRWRPTSAALSGTGPSPASVSGPPREKASGELVGRVGLAYHRLWPSDPEVGWLIDRPWQGRGLATEAGAACLGYAFHELGFERVVCICTAQNAASRKVMEKLGFGFWQDLHDPKHGLELLLHVRGG